MAFIQSLHIKHDKLVVLDLFYTVLPPNSSIKGAGGWFNREREGRRGRERSTIREYLGMIISREMAIEP